MKKLILIMLLCFASSSWAINLSDVKPIIPTIDDTAYDATSFDDNTDGLTKNVFRDKMVSVDSSLAGKTDALEQVITIAASGGDYTTIQSALTANSSGHECFQVAPDTYVNDTINFTANNQTVIAIGKPNQTIITNASQIVECGDYTNCAVANMNFQFTPTTAINMLEVNDGSLQVRDCKLVLTTSSAISGLAQPALLATTGTGTIKSKRGEFYYYHTGATTTGVKAIAVAATGSTIEILRACKIVMTNSGSALVSSVGFDNGTAVLDIAGAHEITVTDTTASLVAGLGYVGGSGDSHFDYCHINVVGGGSNACYGIYNAGTGNIRSSHNDIWISGGSTNYSFYTAAGATTNSHLDDIRAADGYLNSGTFNFAKSAADGEFSASGTIAGATITGANVTSGADPGHTHTAYQPTLTNSAGLKSALSDEIGSGSYAVFANDFATGASDNNTLATKGYVDDNAGGGGGTSYGHICLTAPMAGGSDLEATPDTDFTSEYYGQAQFAYGTDQTNNYVEYRLAVPEDMDTGEAIILENFGVYMPTAGTNTNTQRYVISMDVIASDADYTGTLARPINVDLTETASTASGDFFGTNTNTTLTDWKTDLASHEGEIWLIRVARDGNDGTYDTSTVNTITAPITVRYTRE